MQYLAFASKHDLLVCPDEIHCDLLLTPGVSHIPFASLNEDAAQRNITLMSPSKSFNIAGFGASVAVIPNARLRMKFAAQSAGMVPAVYVLALCAANAACYGSQDWLQKHSSTICPAIATGPGGLPAENARLEAGRPIGDLSGLDLRQRPGRG